METVALLLQKGYTISKTQIIPNEQLPNTYKYIVSIEKDGAKVADVIYYTETYSK